MDPEASHEQDQLSEPLSGWARSLATKAGRARAALSPWVQRMMDPGAPAVQRLSTSGQPRATAFSERDTRALVDRVSRKTEQSRVWHPDVGSVSPVTFDRFAGEIVQRFRPMADKYRVESPEEGAGQESDLTLAPATQPISMLNVGIGPSERSLPRTDLPSVPSSRPAATEQPAALPPAETDAPRPVARSAPRVVQRRPGVRPMSRVEEITPGSTAPPTVGMEPPAQADAPMEAPSEAGAVGEDAAPSGLPVERSAADGPAVLSTDAPLQRAAEPSAIAETRPPELRADMQADSVERRAPRPSPRSDSTDKPGAPPLPVTPGDMPEEPVQRQPLDVAGLAETIEEPEPPQGEVAPAEAPPSRVEPVPPSTMAEAPARGVVELAAPEPMPHPEPGPAPMSETRPLQRKADEAPSLRADEAPQRSVEAEIPSGMDLALPELETPAVEMEQQIGMREIRPAPGEIERKESPAPSMELPQPEAAVAPPSEPNGLPIAQRKAGPGLKPPEVGVLEAPDRTEAPSAPRPGSVEPLDPDPELTVREARQPARPIVQRQPVEEAVLPETKTVPAPGPEPPTPQQPLPRAGVPPVQRWPEVPDQPVPDSGAEGGPSLTAGEELPREPVQVEGVLTAEVAWEAPSAPEKVPPSPIEASPGEASPGTQLPAHVQQVGRRAPEPQQPTVQRQPLADSEPALRHEKTQPPLPSEDAVPLQPVEGIKGPPVEPQMGLEERILARADAGMRLPLTSPRTALARKPEEWGTPGPAPSAPGPAPRIRPVEQAATLAQARIQARLEEEPTTPRDSVGVGEAVPRLQARVALRERPALPLRQPTPGIDVAADVGQGWTGRGRETLPLPPVIRQAPADQVQKLPLISPAAPVVQRSSDLEEEVVGSKLSEDEPAEKKQKVDLDKIARAVYPLVKRMLAIERERIWGR